MLRALIECSGSNATQRIDDELFNVGRSLMNKENLVSVFLKFWQNKKGN